MVPAAGGGIQACSGMPTETVDLGRVGRRVGTGGEGRRARPRRFLLPCLSWSAGHVADGAGRVVAQIFEKKPLKVKNFGIWMRYNSRTDPINMYKEYRDVTLTGAVAQMYLEVAGRHRGRASGVQIIKTAELTASQCKRDQTVQYHVSTLVRRSATARTCRAVPRFCVTTAAHQSVSVGRHRTRRSPSRCRTGCCARRPSRSRAASTRRPGPTRFTE